MYVMVIYIYDSVVIILILIFNLVWCSHHK